MTSLFDYTNIGSHTPFPFPYSVRLLDALYARPVLYRRTLEKSATEKVEVIRLLITPVSYSRFPLTELFEVI